MHGKIVRGCLLTALLLGLLATGSSAKDISIRIDRIAGAVEVWHEMDTAGEWRSAERFADLGPGWQLRTGKDSKAMLVFPFGNICILKANSVLTVDKLDLREGSRVKLDGGGLVADIRSALSPGSEFSVETTSALAVVRGTNFAVDYRTSDSGEPIVWFCCYRGEVELSNEHGPAQLLDEGTFVTVKPGSPVPVPVPSTPKAADFMMSIIDLAPFEAAEAAGD